MVDADIKFLWRRGNVNYFKDSYSVNFNPSRWILFGKSIPIPVKSPLQTFYFSRKQYTGDENQDNALVFGKQLVAFTCYYPNWKSLLFHAALESVFLICRIGGGVRAWRTDFWAFTKGS